MTQAAAADHNLLQPIALHPFGKNAGLGSGQGNDHTENFGDPKWWAKAVAEGKVDLLRRGVTAKPSGLLWLDRNGRTLLHVAASHNNAPVIQLLASFKFDLNAQDDQGKTALHEAIQHDMVDAIHALIEAGARTNIAHNGGLFALLFAVELNQPASLKALISHQDAVDVHARDSTGSTALHYAAAKNHTECMNILLPHHEEILQKNDVGLSCANVAAYAGSADSLRSLFSYAKANNYDVEKIANISDIEGNLLLHAAVDSGSLDTVKVCLEYGAFIDSQQEDQSTPVHFAAMRGELEIIRVMFTAQPTRKSNALCLTDKNGMTVLHKAVLFDNVAVAQFFLDEGAEVDAVDVNEQTALLLAASKQSRKCVMFLMKRGANSAHVDKDGRNFVHLVVLSGANLDSMITDEALEKVQKLRELLNQKDYFGCTPLHYASIEGQLGTTENLLNYGAGLHIHTHSKTTALHFAAQYGRYNTCKKLLDSPYGSHVINATDSGGHTALHMAAVFGHTKVVQLLLERGALFHRAYCGNSPFNMATMQGHTKTMKLMLTFNANLLNLSCKSGNTALHSAGIHSHPQAVDFLLTEGATITLNAEGFTFFDLALKKQNKDVCAVAMKHDRWREILSTLSPIYPSPLFGLIEELPDVCLDVLNRCVTNNGLPARSKRLAVTYDFTFLELDRPKKPTKTYKSGQLDWSSLDRPYNSVNAASSNLDLGSTTSLLKRSHLEANDEKDAVSFEEIIKSPLPVINHMLKFGRVELLVSPLCTEYLSTKWNRFACTHALISIVTHLIAVITLAFTVWLSPPSVQCYLLIDSNCAWSNKTCVQSYVQSSSCATSVALQVCTILGLVFAISRLPMLLIFAVVLKHRFFLDLNNVLLLLTVSLLMACTLPNLIFPGLSPDTGVQWNLLAVATACEYFVFILDLRILSSLGLYVVMFVEILKTLFKSSLTFLFLIVGFALAFTVIFQVPIQQDSDYESYIGALVYNNPVVSILRTMVMTTGELEFYDTLGRALTNPDMRKGLPFPVTAVILYTVFIVFISIAMFNLLVGLAIGDIKVVRSSATLKRIEIQADFYSLVEKFIYKARLTMCHKDPRPESVVVYPNADKSRIAKLYSDIFSSPDTGASKAIDHAIEASNRLYFQRSVTSQLEKEKQRVKKLTGVVEKHMELTKVMMEKMDLKWDATQSVDEGLRKHKTDQNIKSIKSSASADWQNLFATLSENSEKSEVNVEADTDNALDGFKSVNGGKTDKGRSMWLSGFKTSRVAAE